MGRGRLSLSPLLFCDLVEDLWSTNEGFLWSHRTFGRVLRRCGFGWVDESRSHSESWAKIPLAFFVLELVMVALCLLQYLIDVKLWLRKEGLMNRLEGGHEVGNMPNKEGVHCTG